MSSGKIFAKSGHTGNGQLLKFVRTRCHNSGVCQNGHFNTNLSSFAPPQKNEFCSLYLHRPWSFLDKKESLACQITSPFNKKLACFLKIKLKILPYKTNEEVICKASAPLYLKSSMQKLLGNAAAQW